MIEIKFWLIVAMLLEVPAVAMVWSKFPMRKSGLSWWYLTGIYMLTFGLIVQVGRSMNYIKFNSYPVDEIFPWWLFKDFGASILLFCFVKDANNGEINHA